MAECAMDSSHSGQGHVAGYYEQVNKPSIYSKVSAMFFWQSKHAYICIQNNHLQNDANVSHNCHHPLLVDSLNL